MFLTESAPFVAAPQPSAALLAAPRLRLSSDIRLCEATAVRLLTRAGLVVLRRQWLAAARPGGMPVLCLTLAAAPAEQVQAAAQALRWASGAVVEQLP